MEINITKLLTNQIDKLNICDNVNIPNEFIKDSLIYNLKDINLNGNLVINDENNLLLTGVLSGIMTLKDDITLQPVEYKFTTEIEEILNKSKNILDITEILWQNILVEIPSKVRATDEDIELCGDGWRVISENKFNQERNVSNNPFQNLDELLRTKEDK